MIRPNHLTVVGAGRRGPPGSDEGLNFGGGDGTFDDMEARVRELEKGQAVISERLVHLDKRVETGFEALGKKIDKLPNEWSMAKVVFFVMASLMAAAVFGPRLVSMIPN